MASTSTLKMSLETNEPAISAAEDKTESKLKDPASNDNQMRKNPSPTAYRMRANSAFFESLRLQHLRLTQQKSQNARLEDEFPDYRQLVGPDESYRPKKTTIGRMLVVENHGYASLVSRYDAEKLCPTESSQSDLYANLRASAKTSEPITEASIEYATIGITNSYMRQQSSHLSQNVACSGDGSNFKHNITSGTCKSYTSDGASFNGDRSNSSDNSSDLGGFSKLMAPVHQSIELSSSHGLDNFDSLVVDQKSKQQLESVRKQSTFFKKFGFLVSKAISGAQSLSLESSPNHTVNQRRPERAVDISKPQLISNRKPAQTMMIQQRASPMIQRSDCESNSACDHGSKFIDASGAGHPMTEQQTVPAVEADLVILPTKNVNQRKQSTRCTNVYNKASPACSGSAHDRLSRAKLRSRKHEKQVDASLGSPSSGSPSSSSACRSESSVCSSSSSSSSSSCSSSQNSTGAHGRPRDRRRLQGRRLADQKARTDNLMSGCTKFVHTNSKVEEGSNLVVSGSLLDNGHYGSKVEKMSATKRSDIDCASPTADNKCAPPRDNISRGGKTRAQTSCNLALSSRSNLSVFNPEGAAATDVQEKARATLNVAESAPNLSRTGSSRVPLLPHSNSDELSSMSEESEQKSTSGFWGLTSLIGHNHMSSQQMTGAHQKGRKQHHRSSTKKRHEKNTAKCGAASYNDSQESSTYSSLQPVSMGYKMYSSLGLLSEQEQRKHALMSKQHQSLNLYQNLLRNYAKRRQARRGHGHRDHEHRNHHNHHGHHRRTCSCRRAGGHQSERRCNEKSSERGNLSCVCYKTDCCSTNDCSSKLDHQAPVWGQLIKINKSDGTQVIELHRSAGRSWGFFVVRGYINNVKGIFISRMHDTVTSNSLAGLLSLGDRILAIDECPIEPDYDILRVNQLMSRKSKILLKVKPYKG